MKLILVIDLGTSNTKASLFDEPGTVLFEASIKTPTFFDSSRMEIDQDALWVGIRDLVASARASVQMGDTIEAITVSSMACTVDPGRPRGNVHFTCLELA
jgi:sugar (pentulose or hexulose) kinase